MLGKSDSRRRTLWVVWGLWLAALVLIVVLGWSALSQGVSAIVALAALLVLTAITLIAQRYIRMTVHGPLTDLSAPGSHPVMHEQRIRQELIRINRQLLEQLGRDELTGIHNRRALHAFIREAITSPGCHLRPLSVLMMDLDHFKRINDHHGHFAADRLLVLIAQCWVRNIRGSDLLARMGGDEFCLVLPDTTLAQALMVAHKLRDACSDAGRMWREQEGNPAAAPLTTGFQPHADPEIGAISVSIGVANTDHPSLDGISGLLEFADKLLYEAKRAGKGGVIVRRCGSLTSPV